MLKRMVSFLTLFSAKEHAKLQGNHKCVERLHTEIKVRWWYYCTKCKKKVFRKCVFPFKFISCLHRKTSFAILFTICGEMKQFKILIQYKYSNETTLSLRTHRYYCRRQRTRCVIFLTKTCFHYVRNLLFSLKFGLERILHIPVLHTYFLY